MMYKGIKEGRRRWDLNGCSGRILCRIRAPEKVNAETLLISSHSSRRTLVAFGRGGPEEPHRRRYVGLLLYVPSRREPR